MVFRLLFFLALIALPFNDLPYLSSVFGELGGEGAFYPLLLALLLCPLALVEKPLKLPRARSLQVLAVFFLYLLISGLTNLPSILTVSFAGRTGLNKFILQLAVFLFSLLVAITAYNLVRHEIINLKDVRKYVFFSFSIAGIYSIFEILYFFGNPVAITLFELVNPLIHTEYHGILPTEERLRSVCMEPSYLGMYGAFIFPWLAIGILSGSYLLFHVLVVGYFLVIIIMTESRFAYGTIFLQSALLLIIAGKLSQRFSVGKNLLYLSIIAVALLVGKYGVTLITEGSERLLTEVGLVASLADVEENLSNIARFGSQLAGLKMALDHPVFGVGVGQYAFHFHDYIPVWSTISPEIRDYLQGVEWPTVHGLLSRIAAEGGLPALGLWLVFWGYLLREVWGTLKESYARTGQTDWLGMALLVSLVGIFLTAGNADSFRFPGNWLGVGLAWAYCAGGQKSVISEQDHIAQVGK